MWSGWKGMARVTFDACRASRMFLQLAGDVGALQGQAGSPCQGGDPALDCCPAFFPAPLAAPRGGMLIPRLPCPDPAKQKRVLLGGF